MTTELKLQREVVEVVRGAGGFAFKMSNRFLIGVVDLFVKLPWFPAAIYEAKLTKLPAATRKTEVTLDATALQLKFLREARAAGMTTGLMSFVVRGNEFGMDIGQDVHVLLSRHRWCKMAERRKLMLELIRENLK